MWCKWIAFPKRANNREYKLGRASPHLERGRILNNKLIIKNTIVIPERNASEIRCFIPVSRTKFRSDLAKHVAKCFLPKSGSLPFAPVDSPPFCDLRVTRGAGDATFVAAEGRNASGSCTLNETPTRQRRSLQAKVARRKKMT